MLNPIKRKELSKNEYLRYARQVITPEIGKQGQEKLKQTKVLCIGAGGLNSPALLYLAACGIGSLGIIDKDIIEISNLQRQILYKTNDIKKSKALTSFYKLKELNPNITINSYNTNLDITNIKMIFYNYDIIVDGTDNIKTRYIISQYCYQLHKIHIYGAIEKFTGQMSVFNYQNGYNYYDLLKNSPNIIYSNCNTNGLINTLAGFIGILQATEVIKVILGIGSIASEYLLIYNSFNNSYQRTKIRKKKAEEILKIKNYKKIQKHYISIDTLLENSNYLIIDIRTKLEFKIQNITKSINIPLKILKKDNYLQNLKRISFYKIVLYCNDENLSYIASQILYGQNIKHYILKNGLNSIRKERDSNPR